jgi:hypothetical protein
MATSLITSAIASTYAIGQVSGSSVYFAGGGGGMGNGSAGAGGLGGGAPGALAGEANTGGIRNGKANTGGGAGGARQDKGASYWGTGGSGVSILKYSTTYPAASSTSGSPIYIVSGGYRIYIWKSSGSITFG